MTQYKGRIDLRVEGNKFNLSHVKAGGTVPGFLLFKATWLLSEDQEKHWVVSGDMAEDWREVSIEFIAGGTGRVSLEFRGCYFDELDTNHHEVWLDDVRLEGGDLINGSFEETDADGGVAGWSGITVVNRGDIKARTGARCVLVWHDEPAVQSIAVAAAKRYKVSAYFQPNIIKY